MDEIELEITDEDLDRALAERSKTDDLLHRAMAAFLHLPSDENAVKVTQAMRNYQAARMALKAVYSRYRTRILREEEGHVVRD